MRITCFTCNTRLADLLALIERDEFGDEHLSTLTLPRVRQQSRIEILPNLLLLFLKPLGGDADADVAAGMRGRIDDARLSTPAAASDDSLNLAHYSAGFGFCLTGLSEDISRIGHFALAAPLRMKSSRAGLFHQPGPDGHGRQFSATYASKASLALNHSNR